MRLLFGLGRICFRQGPNRAHDVRRTSSGAMSGSAKLKSLNRPAGCLVILAPAFRELK